MNVIELCARFSSQQAVTVNIQGQGAMVIVSQRQYDEMVELMQQLREKKSDNGFTQALSQRFDELIAGMNRAGGARAADAALFGDPAPLNNSYRPGATESEEYGSKD
ncbi:MAG: hypothetical protein R3F53_18420 [Gammaproteobacteria bacterium]